MPGSYNCFFSKVVKSSYSWFNGTAKMVQQMVQQKYNFNYFNYLTTFGTKTVTVQSNE